MKAAVLLLLLCACRTSPAPPVRANVTLYDLDDPGQTWAWTNAVILEGDATYRLFQLGNGDAWWIGGSNTLEILP